jgi:hypothetical protein
MIIDSTLFSLALMSLQSIKRRRFGPSVFRENLMPRGYRGIVFAAVTFTALSVIGSVAAHQGDSTSASGIARPGCPNDDSGLKLPQDSARRCLLMALVMLVTW